MEGKKKKKKEKRKKEERIVPSLVATTSALARKPCVSTHSAFKSKKLQYDSTVATIRHNKFVKMNKYGGLSGYCGYINLHDLVGHRREVERQDKMSISVEDQLYKLEQQGKLGIMVKDQVYKVVMRWPGLNRTRAIVYIRWEKLHWTLGSV